MVESTEDRQLTALGYVRAATQGAGIARQREEIAAYAARQGLRLLHIHVDEGASGLDLGRHGLGALRADVGRSVADVVVVKDADRLSRSLEELLLLAEEFQTAGVEVHDVRQGRLAPEQMIVLSYMVQSGPARRRAVFHRRDRRIGA